MKFVAASQQKESIFNEHYFILTDECQNNNYYEVTVDPNTQFRKIVDTDEGMSKNEGSVGQPSSTKSVDKHYDKLLSAFRWI